VSTLKISAYGGRYGGIIEIDLADGNDKLVWYDGDVLVTQQEISAGERIEITVDYKACNSSESVEDIRARVKFMENMTGEVIQDEDVMTAVRVEVEPLVSIIPFLNRHIVGVGEQVICRVFPRTIPCNINYGNNFVKSDKYGEARINGIYEEKSESIQFSFESGKVFHTMLETMEPKEIVATKVQELKFINEQTNMAGWAGMMLDLVVLPTNVSYSAVYIMEVPEEPLSWVEPSGYFADNIFERIWHHTRDMGAGEWYRVQGGNFFLRDNAQCGEALPFGWRAGQITWRIPVAWGYYSEERQMIVSKVFGNPYHQIFTMTSQGVLRVSKLGYWVERFPDGTRNRSNDVEEAYK
jgi:hypothetical protein